MAGRSWLAGAALLAAGVAAGLALAPAADDNDRPRYGDGAGLPANCRALIQSNLNGYRAKQYTAEEALGSIERNCGVAGTLWRTGRE